MVPVHSSFFHSSLAYCKFFPQFDLTPIISFPFFLHSLTFPQPLPASAPTRVCRPFEHLNGPLSIPRLLTH